MFSAVAYIVPAAAVWAVFAGFAALFRVGPIWLALPALAYSLALGSAEALALPIRSPTIAWQVPPSWVIGRPPVIRTLIWGSVLGPGLLTINPYAGFWLLPIWIAFVASAHPLLPAAIFGLLVGSAHGAGRVLGVWRNERQQAQCGSPALTFTIMTRHASWRLLDGRLLLAAAGALAIYLVLALGTHL